MRAVVPLFAAAAFDATGTVFLSFSGIAFATVVFRLEALVGILGPGAGDRAYSAPDPGRRTAAIAELLPKEDEPADQAVLPNRLLAELGTGCAVERPVCAAVALVREIHRW